MTTTKALNLKKVEQEEQMKSSMWFKIMVNFAIVFWVAMGFVGVFGTVSVGFFGGDDIYINNPLWKFVVSILIIILCGIIYRLLGFLGSWTLFPVYYTCQKIFADKEKIKNVTRPKLRIMLGFILWVSFALIYSLTGGEKELGFLMGSQVIAFFFGIFLAVIFGAFLRIIGYIGVFILSPICLLYRKIFS